MNGAKGFILVCLVGCLVAAPDAMWHLGRAAVLPRTRIATCGPSCLGVVAAQIGSAGVPGESDLEQTMVDDLEDCSPFTNVEGDADLVFEDGVVRQTTYSANVINHGSRAATGEVRAGAYTVVDRTRGVTIRLGGVRRTYFLLVMPEDDRCLLASGRPRRVDVTKSWFGAIPTDPEPMVAPLIRRASTAGPYSATPRLGEAASKTWQRRARDRPAT